MKILSAVKIPYLILLVFLQSNVYAKEPFDLQKFYKSPTTENYLLFLNDYEDDLDVNVLYAFSVMVFDKHQSIVKDISNKFSSLTQKQQDFVAPSLYDSGNQNVVDMLKQKNQFKGTINKLISSDDIKNYKFPDEIISIDKLEDVTMHMDFYWAAFFATSEKAYLEKFIVYASKHHDMLNKKWDESLSQSDNLMIMSMQVLSWSVVSNMLQDPTIESVILELFEKYDVDNLKMRYFFKKMQN